MDCQGTRQINYIFDKILSILLLRTSIPSPVLADINIKFFKLGILFIIDLSILVSLSKLILSILSFKSLILSYKSDVLLPKKSHQNIFQKIHVYCLH